MGEKMAALLGPPASGPKLRRQHPGRNHPGICAQRNRRGRPSSPNNINHPESEPMIIGRNFSPRSTPTSATRPSAPAFRKKSRNDLVDPLGRHRDGSPPARTSTKRANGSSATARSPLVPCRSIRRWKRLTAGRRPDLGNLPRHADRTG